MSLRWAFLYFFHSLCGNSSSLDLPIQIVRRRGTRALMQRVAPVYIIALFQRHVRNGDRRHLALREHRDTAGPEKAHNHVQHINYKKHNRDDLDDARERRHEWDLACQPYHEPKENS